MKIKKLYLVILALALIFSLCACNLSQVSDEPVTSEKNEDKPGQWTLQYKVNSDGETCTITSHHGTSSGNIFEIPTEIDGYKVTAIGQGAFAMMVTMKSITIPEGVTSIGNAAFKNTNLETIVLPDSIVNIESGAFKNTPFYNDDANWENGVLYIGNHLIESKTTTTEHIVKSGTKCIADAAFYGCTQLTKITVPESVITIGYQAFSGCTGLNEIVLNEGLDTIEGRAFDGCTNLKSIRIPLSVTCVGQNTFSGCTSLETIYCVPQNDYSAEWLGNCEAQIVTDKG